MEAAGNEPASPSPEAVIWQGFTKKTSKPLAQTLARGANLDPDLAQVLEAWPTLPEALRAGIVAMVKAAGNGHNPK